MTPEDNEMGLGQVVHQLVFGLGTAQFGMDYGIANRQGRPPLEEIKRIIERALALGFAVIDTAPGYADSESVVGTVMRPSAPFRIVTKTPYFGSGDRVDDPDTGVRSTFERSLARLRRDKVYGLLVHSTQDVVARHGGMLIDVMQELKHEGRVERVGISVYSPQDLDDFAHLGEIDIIQLPLNVLDQRFARNGYLASLKRLDIEVHARSAFLQGVLLLNIDKLPAHFGGIRPTLARFHADVAAAGGRPIDGALAFLASVRDIDCVVVGVDSVKHLEDIAIATHSRLDLPFDRYACEASLFVEPRHWPRRT